MATKNKPLEVSASDLKNSWHEFLEQVSAISVWEVVMLEAKERISLSRPVDDWVQAAPRAPGVRMLRP